MSFGFDDSSSRLSETDSDRWQRRRHEKQSRSERAAFQIRDGRDAARRGARCSSWFAFKLASRSAGARDPAAREESHVSVTSLRLHREQAACEYAGARETSV